MLPVKYYEPEKICAIFKKGEKHPENVKRSQLKSRRQIQHISEPYCTSFTLLFTKNMEFRIFYQKKGTRCMFVYFLFLIFFFQGWLYRTVGLRRSGEGSFERKSKVLMYFLINR